MKRLESLPVIPVNCHFLDSGAFSQLSLSQQYARENNCSPADFYDTDEFWTYARDYAEFVNKYHYAIDYCANIDVIQNPELTWRNQQWLEGIKVKGCPKPPKNPIKPVPVIHFGANMEWVSHYINHGYKFIALGGLVAGGASIKRNVIGWLDRAFNIVCDTPDRLPQVKVHGFGLTGLRYLTRYPFYSVDSTSWTKVGAYGQIWIPRLRGATWNDDSKEWEGGEFVFDGKHWVVLIADHNVSRKNLKSLKDKEARQREGFYDDLYFDARSDNRNVIKYHAMSEREKAMMRKWVEFIGLPIGRAKGGKVIEIGVTTRHIERRAANMLFYEHMRRSIPKYPWPFKSHGGRTIDFITEADKDFKRRRKE